MLTPIAILAATISRTTIHVSMKLERLPGPREFLFQRVATATPP
jgi:hypothetical protein